MLRVFRRKTAGISNFDPVAASRAESALPRSYAPPISHPFKHQHTTPDISTKHFYGYIRPESRIDCALFEPKIFDPSTSSSTTPPITPRAIYRRLVSGSAIITTMTPQLPNDNPQNPAASSYASSEGAQGRSEPGPEPKRDNGVLCSEGSPTSFGGMELWVYYEECLFTEIRFKNREGCEAPNQSYRWRGKSPSEDQITPGLRV